jgi:hypothetical protein
MLNDPWGCATRYDPGARSGFITYAEHVREPDDDGFESTSQAYLIARKPSVPAS